MLSGRISVKTCEFTVKVVPGSSRTAYCGMYGGMVKIKVAAPPEKGKANTALVDYLAGVLAVKKTAVSIVSGQTSPVKQISVEGIESDYVKACFERFQMA
ncbi:MAG: DUF167 domain-containing protein [Phycisphaerae bacterium]|nr:DUF167 domain-containing protein [Phycisphaerae bacterium]